MKEELLIKMDQMKDEAKAQKEEAASLVAMSQEEPNPSPSPSLTLGLLALVSQPWPRTLRLSPSTQNTSQKLLHAMVEKETEMEAALSEKQALHEVAVVHAA